MGVRVFVAEDACDMPVAVTTMTSSLDFDAGCDAVFC